MWSRGTSQIKSLSPSLLGSLAQAQRLTPHARATNDAAWASLSSRNWVALVNMSEFIASDGQSVNDKNTVTAEMVPETGLEPATFALQKRRSTIELLRRRWRAGWDSNPR